MRRSRIRTIFPLLSSLGHSKRRENPASLSAQLFSHLADMIELFDQPVHVGNLRA